MVNSVSGSSGRATHAVITREYRYNRLYLHATLAGEWVRPYLLEKLQVQHDSSLEIERLDGYMLAISQSVHDVPLQLVGEFTEVFCDSIRTIFKVKTIYAFYPSRPA
jgi:hypothetical protein